LLDGGRAADGVSCGADNSSGSTKPLLWAKPSPLKEMMAAKDRTIAVVRLVLTEIGAGLRGNTVVLCNLDSEKNGIGP